MHTDTERLTLSALFREFRECRSDIKPATATLYADTFRAMIAGLGDAEPGNITPLDAARWAAAMHKKTSENTACRHVRTARALFGWAVLVGLAHSNPFSAVSGTPRTRAVEFVRVDRARTGAICDAMPSVGLKTLYHLCRYAGLRRGEAVRLRWADVDLGAGLMRVVPPGAEGTKQRCRTVPIEPELSAFLSAIPRSGDLVVDGLPKALERELQRAYIKAGVGRIPKPLHTLRKNLESEWLARKDIGVMTVCGWLGHAPSVAMRHYQRATDAEIAAVAGGACQR